MYTRAKESTVDTCTHSHYASSSKQDFALSMSTPRRNKMKNKKKVAFLPST